jgi:molecular chaperone Hsp33
MHYKELYRQPLSWRCTCSRDRIKNVLMSLRPADKEELLKDPQVEMTCQYCGARYVISHDELAAMFKQKET